MQSFKSGDILGGLLAMLDIVAQVAAAITGQGQVSVPVFNRGFGGFRAAGGPVVPGKAYVVGEEGPVAIHGVQHLFHPPARLPAWPDSDRRSKIVFITRDLSREFLEKSLREYRDEARKSAEMAKPGA